MSLGLAKRMEEVAAAIKGGKTDTLQKLKRIDFESGKFEANGTTYYLETKMTIGRFCEYQILEKELGYGMTLKEMYDSDIVQRQLLNQTRFVDAAVHLEKKLAHYAKLKEKEPIALKMCTLFINSEDEDRNTWSNDTINKKFADWKAAGIDSADFFAYALTLVPSFIEHYINFTQSISEKLEIAREIVNASLSEL